MSESVATSQVEEVNNGVAPEQVQQKVVESDKVQEEPAKADEVSKSDDKEQVDQQSEVPTESESKVDAELEKKESAEEKAPEEKVVDDQEKPTESKKDDEVAANGAEHSVEDNKDVIDNGTNNQSQEAEAEAKPESEPVAEETNGICKRKVSDTEAEAAVDEKSPKKAKVVEDGDKAPVEETAA